MVYETYDRARNETVALKLLLHAEAAAIYRFKKEFRALADVVHPNLVSLYELVAEGENWFFTMELVEGVNFLEYVREATGQLSDDPLTGQLKAPTMQALDARTMPVINGESTDNTQTVELEYGDSDGDLKVVSFPQLMPVFSLRIERLRAALRQLAEGVHALHKQGKLHRDIKPSNILVTREGRVVILDFGLVTEVVPDDLLQSLHVAGTPAYMSPEQGAGLPLSEASDWYGVGVILYQALTGRLPFSGKFLDVLVSKQKIEPPAPGELVRGIPEDLDALCRDLLRREPQLRPTGQEVLERLGKVQAESSGAHPAFQSTQDAPFVGRERHLRLMTESFLATKQGHTVTVYIHGKSGMGKSTLVRQFLDQLQDREDVVVLAGRCYEQESVPYKALDGVVDSLSKYLASLSPSRADAMMPRDVLALSRLFPVMLQVESVVNAPHREQEVPDPLVLRRRAFAALREMLARLADRQPVVLYIDDLHWADADSTALLNDLLRPPNPPPLLLVASFRSEEIESKPFLQALLKQTGSETCRELSVDSLTREEARDLALSLLPDGMPGSEQFTAEIIREAGGSPFFVEQLTRYALTSERAATTGITLAEMLEARLTRFPVGARQLLEALAVAGHPVDLEVASEAAGLEADSRSLIASLRAAQFLRSSGSLQRIELYHDRIRETLASLLDPQAIRQIHAALARSLEARSFDEPEALFKHYIGAGERERAATQAVRAAKKATAALAFDRAALYYRRALELAPVEGVDLVELKAGLGDALVNAGRGAEAAQVFLDAVQYAGSTRALDFQRRAAEQLLLSGHIDEGLEVIRAVLAAVGYKLAPGPKRALASLLVRRAHLRLRGLKFVEREAALIPEENLLRIDLCWAVAAGLGLVDTIRGADFQTRHLLLALRAGEPYRIARAFAVEAGFSSAAGGPGRKRAKRFLNAAETLARKVDHPHALGMSILTSGQVAYLTGHWKQSVELCEQATEILRDQCTGVTWELSSAQRFVLASLMYMGEMGEISRRMPGLLAAAAERGNLYAATDLRTRLNIIWLAADDPDFARQQVIEALLGWSQKGFHIQHYNSLLALTQIELYTGDNLVAWKHITGQWSAMTSSMLMRIQILRIEAMYLRARGALAAATTSRSPEQFLKDAERLATRIAREKMFWSDPLVFVLRAGIASLTGKQQNAAIMLRTAAEGLERADMKLYAAVARRRLGQIVGGEEGHKLISDANAWMASQDIKVPALMTRVLAPGFTEAVGLD